MLETVFYWFIGVGLVFDLFGCIGLVRLPDVYNRAQAATKCVTLGTCLLLIGTAGLGFAGYVGQAGVSMGVKALMCAAFVLLTSPVGAHAICRGAYLSGVRLWVGSVEDQFASRAEAIRAEQARADAANASGQEGTVQGEEAETA